MKLLDNFEREVALCWDSKPQRDCAKSIKTQLREIDDAMFRGGKLYMLKLVSTGGDRSKWKYLASKMFSIYEGDAEAGSEASRRCPDRKYQRAAEFEKVDYS